jgi:hypothetical protein
MQKVCEKRKKVHKFPYLPYVSLSVVAGVGKLVDEVGRRRRRSHLETPRRGRPGRRRSRLETPRRGRPSTSSKPLGDAAPRSVPTWSKPLGDTKAVAGTEVAGDCSYRSGRCSHRSRRWQSGGYYGKSAGGVGCMAKSGSLRRS